MSMTERQLSNEIAGIIIELGLLGYHTRDSRGSQRGFPDWVICGHHGLLFRELKTDDADTTADQDAWLWRLKLAGQHAGVWRPEHLASGVIRSELTAIARG